jgi:hypothetical protein
LDAAKNMAESAASQFTANQGAIESAANEMKNNMLSQFSALGINI